MRAAGLFLVLFTVWLLWSGLYKPLVIGLGVVSCLICVWIIHRMRSEDDERLELVPLLRAARYFPWLLKEVAISNWNVIRIILAPSLPIDPALITVTASQRSQLGRVTYGNSITLTPGTLTVDVDDDRLTVHGLTRAGVEALKRGEMDGRVTAIEGRG